MKKTKEEKFEAKLAALQERIKKTNVKLTQAQINRSEVGSVTECPIALAFTEAFKGKIHCTETKVYPDTHELHAMFEGLNGDVEIVCEMPTRTVNLAQKWDSDEKVKPITFRINKIMEVNEA